MAVAAAALAAKIRMRVLAKEHKILTKHKVPANPKPQEVGMMLAKKIPKKLAAIQPSNLGQAGRVPGVSQADVSALLLWLELEHLLQQGAVQGLGKGIKLKPEL